MCGGTYRRGADAEEEAAEAEEDDDDEEDEEDEDILSASDDTANRLSASSRPAMTLSVDWACRVSRERDASQVDC
jgi:hypothetical protein